MPEEQEGHKLPLDGGLGNLGLVMMLWGLVHCLIWCLFILNPRWIPNVYLWLMALASIYRGAMHAATGYQLSRRTMPLVEPVRTYFNVALCQTIVTLFCLWGATGGRVSYALFAALGIALMAWPIVLRLLVHKDPLQTTWIRCAKNGKPPIPRDLGQESFGLSLAWMGLVGLAAGATVSFFVFGTQFSGPGSSLLIVKAALALMMARSIIQILSGFEFLRGDSISTVGRKIEIYRLLSWLSSGLLFLGMVLVAKEFFGPVVWDESKGRIIGSVLCLGAITLVWPTIVYRHATWTLHNAQYEIRNEPSTPLMRAKDGGWTTLGYILIALGTLAACSCLLILTANSGAQDDALTSGIMAGVMLIAGFELIRMTPRAKLAARAYALVAIGLVIMDLVSLLPTMRGTAKFIYLGVVLAQIALPLVALYVVQRPLIEDAKA